MAAPAAGIESAVPVLLSMIELTPQMVPAFHVTRLLFEV